MARSSGTSKSGNDRIIECRVHPDVWLDSDALLAAVRGASRRRDLSAGAFRVVRRTIDARRGRVALVLRVQLLEEAERGAPSTPAGPLVLPNMTDDPEVVIVGAGPAGLFCAWRLAQHGIRALLLERGKAVAGRRRDVALLARNGTLDPESNYCFGEGGAGTFSDGKLYTRATKRGNQDAVLEALVGYGAPAAILVDARPHIGTNRLPAVVMRMREHLESAGVEVRFGERVDGLMTRDGRVTGVRLASGERIAARAVVVAAGHSARDVQRWLHAAGAQLEAKSFALGVRIEHPQAYVDRQQFGKLAGHAALGAASYRLVEQACGVGVFSFCMCPGGFICPAGTELEALVVNGWSPSSRRGKFANSGFVTEIGPVQLAAAGYARDDVFAGVAYQQELERRAYQLGGGDYRAPAQRLGDFVARRRPGAELPPCSYPCGLTPAPIDDVLGPLSEPLRVALERINGRMPGFVSNDAVAVAIESRTSCPVRTVRDTATGQSPTLAGLYPCGEGAGYAGGIMSAALDGIRTADHLCLARTEGGSRGAVMV